MAGLEPYERTLAERDVIRLPGGGRRATRLATEGVVRMHTNVFEAVYPNQYINLDEDNPLTRAIDTIQSRTNEEIARNPVLQNLLSKENWTYEDRTVWESHISKIVSEQHNLIPGLGEYRLAPDIGGTRVANLADLSGDIGSNGPYRFEHDCETMSLIEGIVLQRLDKEHLPATATNGNSYKYAGNYFIAGGDVQFDKTETPGGHVFLISSTTGNIIEGTADPDKLDTPYRDTGKDYSFADFIAGKIAVTQSPKLSAYTSFIDLKTEVYGLSDSAGESATIAKRLELMRAGNFESLEDIIFDYDSTEDYNKHFLSGFDRAGDINFTVGTSLFETTTAESTHVKPDITKSETATLNPVIATPSPQLHNIRFAELVDRYETLNDTSGHKNTDPIKDLIEAAKGLGLSENIYGHIEEAINDDKLLEPAAFMKAMSASYNALEKADATNLNNIDTERAVVMAFFENITSDNLVSNRDGRNDGLPYGKEELERIRELANKMDERFNNTAIPHLTQEPQITQTDNIAISDAWRKNVIAPEPPDKPEKAIEDPARIIKPGQVTPI